MPMIGIAMGAAIAAKVKTLGFVIDDPNVDALWEAVGEAVVLYIQTNALVTTTSGAPNSEHTGIVT